MFKKFAATMEYKGSSLSHKSNTVLYP